MKLCSSTSMTTSCHYNAKKSWLTMRLAWEMQLQPLFQTSDSQHVGSIFVQLVKKRRSDFSEQWFNSYGQIKKQLIFTIDYYVYHFYRRIVSEMHLTNWRHGPANSQLLMVSLLISYDNGWNVYVDLTSWIERLYIWKYIFQEGPESISVFGLTYRTTGSLEAFNGVLGKNIPPRAHFFRFVRHLLVQERNKAIAVNKLVESGGASFNKRLSSKVNCSIKIFSSEYLIDSICYFLATRCIHHIGRTGINTWWNKFNDFSETGQLQRR